MVSSIFTGTGLEIYVQALRLFSILPGLFITRERKKRCVEHFTPPLFNTYK